MEEKPTPDGGQPVAHPIPVRLVPAESESIPGLFTYARLESPSGGSVLAYDSHYRLLVDYVAPILALPLRLEQQSSKEYDFDTLRTPRLLIENAVEEIGYQKPAELHFTEPIADVEVATSPPLATKA
ncbi:MAG TPA: hypothetical protein VHS28_05765, partial [Chloroflexota bacterium]|nr:hypothetical protein [Chloroflexota bacterium]